MLLLIASLLLFAAMSIAADINEVGGTRNGYFTLGRQIQFNCDYDNTAFTFVHFRHNNSQVTAGGRFYIQDSITHHSLVVSNTVPSDSGMWSCTLRSIQNQRTITRTTSVMYEESIVLTPVEDSVVGPYQRPYTMTCRGQNIRTWQWIHNNAILRNSSDGRVQVWSRGQIHFTSLQYGDSGVYYCKTGNHFESNVYATYRLTVNALPVVEVVKQPSNIIKENDRVNITCTASGVGLQSVTWSKESDGAQLVSNNDHRITIVHQNDTSITSVLQFSAVTGSQQDTYRCNATSNAGSSYNFTEISLSGLPGAPPPPSLSVLNVTMVMVRWESPNDTGNLEISRFLINYGLVEERGSPLHLELPAHRSEYVFSLLLATRYYFSVAAMNEHGRGPFSEQNHITTNSTTPAGLTVTVTSVTTTSVQLSWQPLTGNDTGGSPITGYIITYYYPDGSEKNVTIDNSEEVDSYWLTGLVDNTEYHVMICALNINGCGEQSSLVDFVTLLSLPDPVDKLNITVGGKDDKLITISWTANTSNAEMYYLVSVTSEEGVMTPYNFTTSMITVDGTMYSVDVPLLKSNECYEVIVTAVNEKGNSPPVSTNFTCNNADEAPIRVEGSISVSDDEMSSNTTITIAVPAAVLLILVILVVAISIYILKRCMRYKRADMELGSDYKNQKRGSEASTAPLNYQRNDSTDTQDSVVSQLSTMTNDSYISESLPFRMSNNGLLDTIQESPSCDELASSEATEDMTWTIGPAIRVTTAEEQMNSPMTMDSTKPFIYDEPMVYTDNAAYFSVSHEFNNKPAADNYSEVKIIPDSRKDGKEVVILAQKR